MSEATRFDGLMDALGSDDEPAKVAEESNKLQKKPLPKYKSPDYKQIGLYLPADLHKRLKIGSAITETEMSAIAEEGIKIWLDKNGIPET